MRQYSLLVFTAAVLFGTGVQAADVSLTGSADDTTRWYDYFSNAYAELGETNFIDITTPTETYGLSGGVYPNGASFDIGTLSYDETGLTGVGSETASVTGYSADFAASIADNDNILGGSYTTAIASPTGTIDFQDGEIVSIDFNAQVIFTYDYSAFNAALSALQYVGTFTVSGDEFSLVADEPTPGAYTIDTFNFRHQWDATGTVDQVVPEPGGALLFAGVAGILFRRRRGVRMESPDEAWA